MAQVYEINNYCDNIIENFLERYASDDTKSNYLQGFKKFFGNKTVKIEDLRKINILQAQKYVKELFDEGLSGTTVRLRIAPLKGLWDYCNEVYANYTLINVWGTKTIKHQIRMNTEENDGLPYGDILTDDEVKRVLDIPDLRDKTIMAVFLYTGMRRSELCSLKWDDIKLDNNEIVIFGKGRKYRTIEIHPELLKMLVVYKNKYEQLFDGSVFGYSSRTSLNKKVNTILKKCGIYAGGKQLSCHGLRHTTGTEMAGNGASPYYIAQVLGHSKIETSMKYVHRVNKKGKIEGVIGWM